MMSQKSKFEPDCACLENLNRIVYIFQRHAKKDSSWRHKRGIFDEIITAHESLARVVSKSFQATKIRRVQFFTHLCMLLDT